MFPFVFEWHWDLGHFIFFGLWYGVLTVLGIGMMLVSGKTAKELMSPEEEGEEEHH